MRKILMIIAFVMMITLMAGCDTQDSVSVDETDYRTGSQGLVMEFIPNAPPSKLYDGDNLELMLEIRNKGAYPETDSFDGELFLSGFDPNAIRGTWEGGSHIPVTLQGRSSSYPDGGYDIKTYKDMNGISIPFGGPKYDAAILVTSCYKYKTIAEPMVCIDPEPYKVVEERKVCHYNDGISTGGTQGAPVAVTRVEERISSDYIIFDIYVSNVGDGKVIDWASYNLCPFDLGLSDVNRVRVNAKLAFDAHPECTPGGSGNSPVVLRDGNTGFISCKFRKPNTGSAFKTPLHIELDYVYSSSIEKRVEIVKV